MTIIAGVEHEGKVYIGGDSSASNGWIIRPTSVPKVFKRGPFLIGYTSSFRMGQILQHHLPIPKAKDFGEDMEYMVTGFIPAVRICLKEHGYMRVHDNSEEGGSFLVGYKGRLYSIDTDQQVNHYRKEGFDATGSGEAFALAALKAFEDLPPRKRIRKALQIAGHFTTTVVPPYYIKVLKK